MISSSSEIGKIVKKIIQKNEKAVKDFKAGEAKAMNFLIGQVMRLTDKRADYKTAKEELEKNIK